MDTQDKYEILEASHILVENFKDLAPNWLRMIDGASEECIEDDTLWNALIEEVKAKMEKDDASINPPK